MKYAVKLTRLALGSMLGVLNQETFTVRSVRDLMWGYNDSLFKLAKDVMPPENVVPHDLFGLFVGVCFIFFFFFLNFNQQRLLTFWLLFYRKTGRPATESSLLRLALNQCPTTP